MDIAVMVKYKKMLEQLKELKSVCVAFSGGVDSTLLIVAAREALGDQCIAVTVDASMTARREFNEAKATAERAGIRHLVMQANEYSVPEFVENGPERCYYCKKAIFTGIGRVAKSMKMAVVIDGSNADDDNDYRPGHRALKELKVVSPLKAAGLTKAEIRELLRHLGYETHKKPSMACLASRIPYGTPITRELLAKVEEAEEHLFALGFENFRVRAHGDVARVELWEQDLERVFGDKDLRERIRSGIREAGFLYVAMDLDGYRTGSMNAVLDIEK